MEKIDNRIRQNTPPIIKASPKEREEAFDWMRQHPKEIKQITHETHSEKQLHINMSNKNINNIVRGSPIPAIKKKKDYKGQRLYIKLNEAKTPEARAKIYQSIKQHFASIKLIAEKQ
jgi:hypothetical protein